MLVQMQIMGTLTVFANCFAATGHQKTRGSTPLFSAVTWSPHSTACSICVEMATQSQGGCPPKVKKRKGGRPSSVVNIANIMELDPSKPLSDKHEQALVFMLSIKASQSTGLQKLIEIKTGGPQPVTYAPVTVARKQSEEVTPRTLRTRTKELKEHVGYRKV